MSVSDNFVVDCRNGFAANLRRLNREGSLIQVDEYLLSNPTPPSAFAFPGGPAGDIEYDEAGSRGLDLWAWTVQVIVGNVGDRAAQMILDQFLVPAGTTSVKEALEFDPTLGGAVEDLHVTTCTGYRQFVFDGRPPALGAEWYVNVYASGRS